MNKLNIKQIKQIFKIADVSLNKKHKKNHIKFVYLEKIKDLNETETKNFLRANNGRIYIFVVNGIVKKIGGSNCKGGIKNTLSFYQNSMQGRPSIRSLGIHILLKESLEKQNNVEVYMRQIDPITGKIRGLFGESRGAIFAYKESESKCKDDYYKRFNIYPDWNFQENGNTWRNDIKKKHTDLLAKSKSIKN